MVPREGLEPGTRIIYIIASFHTHTTTYYRTIEPFRQIGASTQDVINANNPDRNLPGFVFDYIATANDRIPNGHDINSDAAVYRYGTSKRPTPQ